MYELKHKNGSSFRPYQYMIRDFILNVPKCAVWSFMGSGKTVSTLTALDTIQMSGLEERPALVVAPLRVARDVWPNEIHEWPHLEHMKIVPVLGTPHQRLDALRKHADVYTINFENLEWLIGTLWDRWPFGSIVIDESTKIKSLRASVRKNKQGTEFVAGQGGARAKALLKVVYQHKPSRFIELSGTPASKGLQDLWGQIYFLDYGKRLGNVFEAFKNRWFRQSYDGFSIEPQPFAQEQIQDQLKDICLALKSEDWFDLEKSIQRDIVVELPTEARRMYRDMERTLLAEIANGHKIEAFNAGARTMKCRQLAAGAAYLGKPGELPGKREWAEIHDAKLDALEEIVEECGGAPILVAYNFKSDLERLMKRFKHGRHLDNKPQTIKDWNAGKIPILFSHPESAGHGLNLQHGGNILVYFSFDWKAEPYAQIAERIGPVRQAQAGYKRNVYIYRIIAKNTVEEDIIDVLEKNRSIEETLMNGLKRRVG